MQNVMILATVTLLAIAHAAYSQHAPDMLGMSGGGNSGGSMSGGGMSSSHAPRSAEPSASTRAFEAAMMKMHRDMAVAYTGNADRDSAAGMLPHHQGAVDMAEVELQYGKDPTMRRLAQDVVASQEKEITIMKVWLAGKPH